MTPVTATGSISISHCFKCEKVFLLADQLKKNMQEFEIFTMELQFDPKSAKSKSQQVLSNFWQLISTIQSLTIGEDAKAEKDSCANQTSTRIVVSVEQPEPQSNFHNLDKENEPAKSESKTVGKLNKLRSRQQPKPNLNFKTNPNPNMTPKRLNELKRANALLRTIKYETPQGFYNLFECLKCQRQFNDKYSSLRHVQNLHMSVGTKCTNCHNPFFTKSSLELHIPNCSKRQQLQQIKVWLSNESKNPVKVHLHPPEKQKQPQKQKYAPPTRNRKQKSSNKIPKQRGKQTKIFDPLKIKVRNPFENFSLGKTLNVKVVIERFKMEEKEETSVISQITTIEGIVIGTGKETSLAEFIAPAKNGNESENNNKSNFI